MNRERLVLWGMLGVIGAVLLVRHRGGGEPVPTGVTETAPPATAGQLSHFSGTAPMQLGDWKERPLPRSPIGLDDYLANVNQPSNRRLVLGGIEYQTLPGAYRTASEQMGPQFPPGAQPPAWGPGYYRPAGD